MDVQAVMTLIVLAILGFMGFCIYFIFKQLQFVIQAINLYKDMVGRQDMMISLLRDIRETSKLSQQSISARKKTVCSKCGKQYEGDLTDQYCEECGTKLS